MSKMPMPMPIALTDDAITFSLSDWRTILDMIEEAEDAAALSGYRVTEETFTWSDAEVGRLLDGESEIRVLRDRVGMTLRDLAARAGISFPYVSEIESGKKPGSARALGKLARALGVSMDVLLPD